VWVLVYHFKSQSGGGGPKRNRQAQGVRDIVDALLAAGEANIVVMGDLNEGPAVLGQPAANLATLVDPNGPLVEVYALPTFNPGPRPGTFQSCGIRNRLDYILVSHDLAGLGSPAHWDIYVQITGEASTSLPSRTSAQSCPIPRTSTERRRQSDLQVTDSRWQRLAGGVTAHPMTELQRGIAGSLWRRASSPFPPRPVCPHPNLVASPPASAGHTHATGAATTLRPGKPDEALALRLAVKLVTRSRASCPVQSLTGITSSSPSFLGQPARSCTRR
jgi:hypothetical protein